MSEQDPIGHELRQLATLIGRLERGEITRTEFRTHSAHLGLCPQRQPDLYFIRLRPSLGALTVAQLHALADAAENWGAGECHLTTRQGIELHQLSIRDALKALKALGAAGLSSRENGGNTVRSIVVCPHPSAEANGFDVTEYAALLQEHLLRHSDFQALPRKLKIGFSCCAEDCTHTVLQDLGFQARLHVGGERGFRVMAGGGAGASPRLGSELIAFLPANDLLIFCEAFLHAFNRLGNRENPRRARIKFLLESLGVEKLRHEIEKERQALAAKNWAWPIVKPPTKANQEAAAGGVLRAPVRGGIVASGQLRALAAIVGKHHLALRTTTEQDFMLRNVRPDSAKAVQAALQEAKLGADSPHVFVTACLGSTVCSRAFTNSQAVAQEIARELAKLECDKSRRLPRVRVSGCSNGCALHAIAEIGLEGVAQKREGGVIPAYRLWIGGRSHQRKPRLALDLGIVPARRVPACLSEMISLFQRERRDAETVAETVDRIGVETFAAVARWHQRGGNLRELSVDWGEHTAYRLRVETAEVPAAAHGPR